MSVSKSTFLSPISKLLRFFQRSRDKWKEKCKAAKRENKSLKYRLAKMTESRDRWKAKARGSQQGPPVEGMPAAEAAKKRLERGSRGPGRRDALVGVCAGR